MTVCALALDPGVTTGYAFGAIENNTLTVAPGQERFTLSNVDYLLQSIVTDFERNWNVVYETFEYRNYARAGLDLTPVKVIGIIELFRERYSSEVNFWPQSAAMGKAFHDDDKLKEKGLWPKGKPHARDAIRHLLRWCSFGAGGRLINHITAEYEMVEVDIFTDKYMGGVPARRGDRHTPAE